MTPTDWLLSGDTGTSSETIFAVMVGSSSLRRADTPHDADDFGRCYRLLMLFPEWRRRLPEVAAAFPKWGPMAAAWDELTALYERLCDPAGRVNRESYEQNKAEAKTLYARLRKLNDEGLLADGWKQTGPGCFEKGDRSRVKVGDRLTIES